MRRAAGWQRAGWQRAAAAVPEQTATGVGERHRSSSGNLPGRGLIACPARCRAGRGERASFRLPTREARPFRIALVPRAHPCGPCSHGATRDGGKQIQRKAHTNDHIERDVPKFILQKAGLLEKSPLGYLAPVGRYTSKRSFFVFLLKFIRSDY